MGQTQGCRKLLISVNMCPNLKRPCYPPGPGRDDDTGDELEQREDDKPESVRRRLGLYDEATAPLVDFYESKGVLKTFQGTMSDVIYPEVKTWLDGKLAPQ